MAIFSYVICHVLYRNRILIIEIKYYYESNCMLTIFENIYSLIIKIRGIKMPIQDAVPVFDFFKNNLTPLVIIFLRFHSTFAFLRHLCISYKYIFTKYYNLFFGREFFNFVFF